MSLLLLFQTPSGGHTVVLGQATETDLAQAITWNPKIRILGQPSETDLAQAISAILGHRVILGQATETDLAQTFSVATSEHRATQVLVEAMVIDDDPRIATTQVLVEVIGEPFWHGWGIIPDAVDN